MLLPDRLSSHLDAWKRIGAPAHVLQWIQEGIKIPFLDGIPPGSLYTNPYRLTDSETRFVRSEIAELLESGAIQQVYTRPHCVSPIKCVPKKSGKKYRLITDLRLLNDHIDPPTFQQESINTVSQIVLAGDELVTFDLKNGFLHVPIHIDHRQYLGFEFEGRYFVWCVLPFGLCCSPYFFHKVVRPAVSFLREQHIRLSVYVDDGLVAARPSAIVDHRDFVLDTLDDLGFLVNYQKSSLEPSTRKDFIGYTVDTDGQNGQPWLYIPKAKLHKLKKDIRRCLRLGVVHARLLAKIAGQGIAMSKAIAAGKLKLRSLYALLSTKVSWTDSLVLDEDSREDLEWWLLAAENWNGSPLHSRPIQRQVWTDASNTGWGCVHDDSEASGTWDPLTVRKHINYKELLTVLFALKSFAPDFRGMAIQILTDSSTVVAYVNNLGGPVRDLTNVAERIWATAFAHGMTLEAKHVSGVSNVEADRLSRLPVQYEWMLHPRLFACLDAMWGPHSIDRFASLSTAQIDRYNSRFLDPKTLGVDALAQNDWASENNYVNPPFRLLNRVLTVIEDQQAYATVIAPRWPGQVWFPRLVRMLIAPPLRIRNSPRTMLRMGDMAEPLKNRHWKIYAWRVYGGKGSPS